MDSINVIERITLEHYEDVFFMALVRITIRPFVGLHFLLLQIYGIIDFLCVLLMDLGCILRIF